METHIVGALEEVIFARLFALLPHEQTLARGDVDDHHLNQTPVNKRHDGMPQEEHSGRRDTSARGEGGQSARERESARGVAIA